MNKNTIKNNDNDQLFLITKKALPKALLEVLKVKDLVENKKMSVALAANSIGISRTTYYKYCNEVFTFDDSLSKESIILDITTIDTVGLLSNVTKAISNNKFNIVTINQNKPVNKMTVVNIEIVMTNKNCNINNLTKKLKTLNGVKDVQIKKIDKT